MFCRLISLQTHGSVTQVGLPGSYWYLKQHNPHQRTPLHFKKKKKLTNTQLSPYPQPPEQFAVLVC